MKIVIPSSVPENQYEEFYKPNNWKEDPTEEFPNRVITPCGKHMFTDKTGKVFKWELGEHGKMTKTYYPRRGWWAYTNRYR